MSPSAVSRGGAGSSKAGMLEDTVGQDDERKLTVWGTVKAFGLAALLFCFLPLSPVLVVLTLLYQFCLVHGKLSAPTRLGTFVVCVFLSVAWIPFVLLLLYVTLPKSERRETSLQINGILPITSLLVFYGWGVVVAFRMYTIDTAYEQDIDRPATTRLRDFPLAPPLAFSVSDARAAAANAGAQHGGEDLRGEGITSISSDGSLQDPMRNGGYGRPSRGDFDVVDGDPKGDGSKADDSYRPLPSNFSTAATARPEPPSRRGCASAAAAPPVIRIAHTAYDVYCELSDRAPTKGALTAAVAGIVLGVGSIAAARVIDRFRPPDENGLFTKEPMFSLSTAYFCGMFVVLYTVLAFVVLLYLAHIQRVWLLTFLVGGGRTARIVPPSASAAFFQAPYTDDGRTPTPTSPSLPSGSQSHFPDSPSGGIGDHERPTKAAPADAEEDRMKHFKERRRRLSLVGSAAGMQAQALAARQLPPRATPPAEDGSRTPTAPRTPNAPMEQEMAVRIPAVRSAADRALQPAPSFSHAAGSVPVPGAFGGRPPPYRNRANTTEDLDTGATEVRLMAGGSMVFRPSSMYYPPPPSRANSSVYSRTAMSTYNGAAGGGGGGGGGGGEEAHPNPFNDGYGYGGGGARDEEEYDDGFGRESAYYYSAFKEEEEELLRRGVAYAQDEEGEYDSIGGGVLGSGLGGATQEGGGAVSALTRGPQEDDIWMRPSFSRPALQVVSSRCDGGRQQEGSSRRAMADRSSSRYSQSSSTAPDFAEMCDRLQPYNLSHLRAWDEVRRLAANEISSPGSVLNAFFTPTVYLAALGFAAAILYLVVQFLFRGGNVGPFVTTMLLFCLIFSLFLAMTLAVAKKARRHFKLHNVVVARIAFDIACELDRRTRRSQIGTDYFHERKPGLEILELPQLKALYQSLTALRAFMDSTSPRPLLLGIEHRHVRYAAAYFLIITANVLFFALLRSIQTGECNFGADPTPAPSMSGSGSFGSGNGST